LAVLDHLLAQQAPPTTVPGPVIQLQGPRAVALVIAIGLAIAVLWSLPIWLDARRAYKLRERALDLVGGKLLAAASKDGLKMAELRELLATIGEPATGQRGLARALMAFTIITVVGVALVALLLSGSADSGDLRKTVITSLLTLLGTIVGFYYGTRAAEAGTEPAPPTAPTTPVPPPPDTGATGAEAGAAGAAGAAAAAGAEEEVAAAGAEETALAGAEEEEIAADVAAEEVTPYEGTTEPDQEGAPQPVADEEEDDDPENLGGEELPDDGEELPDEEETP
jgi:hypothetical protein